MQYRKYIKHLLAISLASTLSFVIIFQFQHRNSYHEYEALLNKKVNQKVIAPGVGVNAVNNGLKAQKGTTLKTVIVSKNKSTEKSKPSTKPKQKKRFNCLLNASIPKLKIFDGSYPNVTVVTAYFNIGKFIKGAGTIFDTPLYTKWAESFKNLQNPVIFYTDSKEFEKIFAKVRLKHVNTTTIIRIDRKELWSFQWVDRIKEIYSIKGYPKHHPNTVVPEYSCVQHSKYAVVEDAILKNYSTTKYITWIDVGYFRYIVNRNKPFWIVKPQNFNDSRIAMNDVSVPNMTATLQSIFKKNMVWIGGGMSFGVPKVYLDFVQDYKRAVERYLNMSLMNTDQQVIYAMNTLGEQHTLKPKANLQLYLADAPINCWFYLGYSCYREKA